MEQSYQIQIKFIHKKSQVIEKERAWDLKDMHSPLAEFLFHLALTLLYMSLDLVSESKTRSQ